MTLNPVTTPSNNTKPTFSGTASESLPVTVKIYSGSKVEGSPVASAEGPVSGGKWGAISSSTPLTNGIYTAVAVEQSSLENAAGESAPITFVVNTNPPEVAIEPPPPTRSKENKPTFKGTASEAGTVTVKVYKGTEAKGEEAAKLSATVTEGKWTASVTGTLPDGKYTVQATESSAIGNGPGSSAADQFEVFTSPPTVTLDELAARSKENKPTFKGTASEPGQVTVHVYKGKEAKGTEAVKLTATVGAKGEWAVSPGTALADETYTAVATEPSAIGNESGRKQTSADVRSLHRFPRP